NKLWLVASCRYRHADFADVLLPVTPLSRDALFRVASWMPELRRLTPPTRGRLVDRLAGHPRALEYADDLVRKGRTAHGARRPPSAGAEDPEREWADLVEPVLPRAQERLWANLLLAEIWARVLDERARRMLYRMSLLRRPWESRLLAVL